MVSSKASVFLGVPVIISSIAKRSSSPKTIFDELFPDLFGVQIVRIMTHSTDYGDYVDIYIFVSKYITSFALLIVTFADIGTTCFISFLIYKFKELRTRTNYILLNLMISSTLHILINLFLGIFVKFLAPDVKNYGNSIEHGMIVALFMIDSITLLLVLYLAIDWLILANNLNLLSKYQQYLYPFVILGIYVLSLKDCLLYFIISDKTFMYIQIEIIGSNLLFLLSGIIVLIFFIIKKCKRYSLEQSKIDYALAISCTYFILWLPCFILYIIVFIILPVLGVRIEYILLVNLVSETFGVFGYACPLAYVAVLSIFAQNFKNSFNCIFKRTGSNTV
ncbi:uncharacterized protein LOC126734941 isoform X2 [Anthonomus grandis grandis]|uniref:uncharacterized protein LOC126734941 isoform X2 n=1 Tax=Anthonomus grandis grandis TaxID=2921223 RepID=UPI002166A42D|nr:uncharacterized protein LOC126734941 isoform X2 [Anthonomus grandis grandis]